MRPQLEKFGARRNVISGQYTVADTGLNLRDDRLDRRSLRLKSTQVASGPKFV